MRRNGPIGWFLAAATVLGCDAVLVLEVDPDAAEHSSEAADEADGDGDGREADARPETTDVPAETAEVPADVDAADDVGEPDDADDAPDSDVPLGPCPDDMVAAGRVCIDRYEASRPDARADHPQGNRIIPHPCRRRGRVA